MGDYILPSGLEDGTAIASRKRGLQAVAKALAAQKQLEGMKDQDKCDGGEEGAGCGGGGGVHLVECSVIAPSETVRGRLQVDCCFGVSLSVPAVVALAVCFVLALVWGPALFSLMTAEEEEASALPSPSLPAAAPMDDDETRPHCPAITFNCSWDSRDGCCVDCDDDDFSNVVAEFPSIDPGVTVSFPCPAATHTGVLTRSCIGTGTGIGHRVDSLGRAVSGGKWGAINGSCTRRTCQPRMVHLSGFSMSMVSPDERLHPSMKHRVLFPKRGSGSGILGLPCPPGGTYRTVWDWKTRRSGVHMTCAANSTEWQHVAVPGGSANPPCVESPTQGCATGDLWGQTSCLWKHCRSQMYNAGTAEHIMMIKLPDLTLGESIDVSCCSKIAVGGGCAGRDDGIGVVTVSCVDLYARRSITNDDPPPKWQDSDSYSFNHTAGQCLPTESFGLSLSAVTPDGNVSNSAALLSELWSRFSTGMSSHVSASTGGAWLQPLRSDGMLGVLNLQRDGEWRPVATRPSSRLHNSSIDTRTDDEAKGSRVVAAGNVACRELGFAGASFVTNCQGLGLLIRAHKGAIDGDTELLASLCSRSAGEQQGSRSAKLWLELNSEWDRAMQPGGEWLPVVDAGGDGTTTAVSVSPVFRGQPPWIYDSARPSSWCVGDELASDNASAMPCDLGSGSMGGVCATGGAGAVARCFQHELTSEPQGPDLDSPPGVRKSRDKTLMNNYNLVVGCTGYHKPAPDADMPAGNDRGSGCSGGSSGGTWLVGDGIGDSSTDDVASPKIFADTMPHQTSGQGGKLNSWGRLQPGTTEHAGRFHPDPLVDPHGTKQRWSDANVVYPGEAACARGCCGANLAHLGQCHPELF